jgi:hypothetical protein
VLNECLGSSEREPPVGTYQSKTECLIGAV